MSWLDRYRGPILLALTALVAVGLVVFILQRRDGPRPLEIRFDAAGDEMDIKVHVTGAVLRPGVYDLRDGDRVADALEVAGGPSDDADLVTLNLARRVHDEDQVIVPRQGQAVSQVAGSAQMQLVNINTAPAELLDSLPGIGEVYSGRIVESRNHDGPFENPDDLVTRQLIPRSTYEKIKDLITVGP